MFNSIGNRRTPFHTNGSDNTGASAQATAAQRQPTKTSTKSEQDGDDSMPKKRARPDNPQLIAALNSNRMGSNGMEKQASTDQWQGLGDHQKNALILKDLLKNTNDNQGSGIKEAAIVQGAMIISGVWAD